MTELKKALDILMSQEVPDGTFGTVPSVGDRLEVITRKFMADQKIGCPEDVWQSDRVIENAYEFIAELCEVVGYPESGD